MKQPETSDSDDRVLVEIQISDMPGRTVADGRFVLKIKDGVGRLVETLRPLGHPAESLRMDLRVSELLQQNERDELERLRRTVRELRRAEEADR